MRIHFWNVALSLLFAVLLFLGLSYLYSVGRFPLSAGLGDFILMALAIFRLTRLFTYDHITKFIRDWFVGAKEGSLRGTLGSLINCPWCTGLWFSGMVVILYYATPFVWPLALILALAGVASFIQILANLIGWHAEGKKKAVQQ